MQINIPKKELHLAAYMKAAGASFISYKLGSFVFESDLSDAEWRVKHSNSEALKVDRELFTLKAFFKDY
jgi:hypothetical protein